MTLPADLQTLSFQTPLTAGGVVASTEFHRRWQAAVQALTDLDASVAALVAAPETAITALTGDVTATGPGSVAGTIADNAVTYAKLQDVAANSVLARAAATDGDASAVALAASRLIGRGSTGDVAAITLGTGLSMSGTTLNGTAAGALTLIGSDNSGSRQISSIPATYKRLWMFGDGISTSNDTTLDLIYSVDAGTTPVAFYSMTVLAASTYDFVASINNYGAASTHLVWMQASAKASSGADPSALAHVVSLSAAIDFVAATPAAGTVDAGTLYLFGET